MFFPQSRSRVFGLAMLSVVSILLLAARPFDSGPDTIPLPKGFQPEGIATASDNIFYVGSVLNGAIFRGDLQTGEGSVFIQGQEGRQAAGLKVDSRTDLLYAAGATTGKAFVYDLTTGAEAATIQLTSESTTFVNDEVITDEAVYFTDSYRAVLYKVPLDSDGKLPDNPTSEEIPLSGDYKLSPNVFNANGIVATSDGDALIIVNTGQGALYKVDPKTGAATLIDLGGGSVMNGDGLYLNDKTLYVVQNTDNKIAVVDLEDDYTKGTIKDTITSDLFRVPTTIAENDGDLYVVNARFDVTPAPDTEYEVVRVPLD